MMSGSVYILRFITIFLLVAVPLTAQCKPVDFKEQEDSLVVLSSGFLDLKTTESEKESMLGRFNTLLKEVLENPESIHYPFSALKSVSVLTSPEHNFRIFTWFTLSHSGYAAHGMIQYINQKKQSTAYDLTPMADIPRNILFKTLNTDAWLGVVYYDMIEFKQKSKKFYLLLGFDGNNGITHKKVIDVLYFAPNGSPRFGSPVFTIDKRQANRVMFEYSAKAKFTLKYYEKSKVIVYDHLAPERPELEGQYPYYVPDLSYDALKLEHGKWTYKEDFDARNMDENKGKDGQKYNLKLPGSDE